jgi:hypothetical protein
MSGVIDDNGQQWEHCCHCGNFTKIQDLVTGYSPKWPNYPWVDMCKNCKSRIDPDTPVVTYAEILKEAK